MAYVALSRIRTISGLILIKFDPSKIKASDVVTKEYNRLEKNTDCKMYKINFVPYLPL